MTKTILYIHQSSELYGSDKALFYLAKGIKENSDFNPIIVLPDDGPLKTLFEKQDIKVIVCPVVKVSREMFKIKKILLLPFKLISASKKLKYLLNGTKIDIIHSNTLAVLLGAFYGKRYRIKHIWHIHEIIKKPRLVSKFYPILVDSFSDIVVFNSNATKVFLTKKRKRLNKKSVVNLNGMERDTPITLIDEIKNIRENIFNSKSTDLVLGLVGRISKWKGQKLLLESFHELIKEYDYLKLIYIGSAPPNQEYLVGELQKKIDFLNMNDKCKIIPFQNNIWAIWDSIDFAVIPSTEPEPFGLVAVEAMLAKKAVIAAKHGGLVEIVEENKTGHLFKPKNVQELSKAIKKLLSKPENLKEFGLNGHKRALVVFSLKRHVEDFITIYKNI